MEGIPQLGLGNRVAPIRFIVFLVISLGGFAVTVQPAGWAKAALIGFDAGALIFLLSCISLLNDKTARMRVAARQNDANRGILLVITGIVLAVVLVAIGVELGQKKQMHAGSTGLIIGTLLIAWLFSNGIYAMHYAHLYYTTGPEGDGDCGGIEFPGNAEPDYWDFVYFAFTLGMTFQTSDMDISSGRIRRIVIFHCFAAFVFNIGVLAFTINVLGGGS